MKVKAINRSEEDYTKKRSGDVAKVRRACVDPRRRRDGAAPRATPTARV